MINARNTRIAWQAALNWGVILSGMLLYNGLTALAVILVARQVDPVAYGQYVASVALAGFLVVIPGFGMDAWLLTRPQRDAGESGALWWSTMRARTPLLLLWVGGMLLLTFVLPAGTYPAAVFWPTVFALALESISMLCFAALRTQHRHLPVSLLQAASAGLLFLSVFLLPVNEHTVALFALTRAVIAAGTAALVIVLLWRSSWAAARRQQAALTPAKQIFQHSQSFMWAELASAIYVRADITIVSLYLGAGASGIYGPAINVLQLCFLAPRALFFFMVPVLSRSFQDGRADMFRRQAIAQTAAKAVMGLFFSLVLFFFSAEIIEFLFQDAYSASAEILRLLSPIPFLRSLNFALAAILTSSDRQHERTRIQLSAAGFNVLGNLVVVSFFGLVGVSIIYVLSELGLCLGYGILWARGLRRQKPQTV